MVAVLTRLLGLEQLDTAQDIVQETLLQAMTVWRYSGMPEHPAAWMYRTAKNRAIDHLRREKRWRSITPQYHYLQPAAFEQELDGLFADEAIQDSQLRMIFACCHPAVGAEAQVALALRTLCGLSVSEIARAFLTGEETIAKRIYRAREKMRHAGVLLEVPGNTEFPSRLDAVLRCLYLLFNEGYHSAHPDKLIREDLCEEAMRLAYLLTQQPLTDLPRTRALLSLFCFQASRLHARLDDRGHIILMKYQDRSQWFQPLMGKGFYYFEQAAIAGELSSYHLEAAIASLHATAPSFEATDWKTIYFLYGQLYQLRPTPVVALNKAIACAYANDRREALEQLLDITSLAHYHLYHASVGELYLELGDHERARICYHKALQLTTSRQEQQLIREKIEACG